MTTLTTSLAAWPKRQPTVFLIVAAEVMSVVALSLPLPEMIILRKVLQLRLIVIFVSIVAAGILAVGFIFNALL